MNEANGIVWWNFFLVIFFLVISLLVETRWFPLGDNFFLLVKEVRLIKPEHQIIISGERTKKREKVRE